MMRRLVVSLACLAVILTGVESEARVRNRTRTIQRTNTVNKRKVRSRRIRSLRRCSLASARLRASLVSLNGRHRSIRTKRARTKRTRTNKRARTKRTRTNKRARYSRRQLAVRKRARASLRRLRRADRRQVKALLRTTRVQRSMEARYAVAAYLMLRTAKGGRRLPLTIAQMKQIVSSKHWTPRRIANLGRVLMLARQIARSEKVDAKTAFKKALERAGVYKKYSRGVCGA